MSFVEKKIYSQAGEDGVIQGIFKLIGLTNKLCVEFGSTGACDNTKFLRTKQGWKAVLFDRTPTSPKTHAEFITAANIVTVFKKYKVPLNFDLLSIDIDGNDYWVWKALEGGYRPRVVIIEYNCNFPLNVSKTIKYDEKHKYDRTIYYGATLTALQKLGKAKGYNLVHVSSFLNLFFVDEKLLPAINVESAFKYPLDIKRETAKWKTGCPGWFDYSKGVPKVGDLSRPWVIV